MPTCFFAFYFLFILFQLRERCRNFVGNFDFFRMSVGKFVLNCFHRFLFYIILIYEKSKSYIEIFMIINNFSYSSISPKISNIGFSFSF